MRDTVRTASTLFLCFAGSGRSTCAPNALGRERALHPQSLGIVIRMSHTMPYGSVQIDLFRSLQSKTTSSIAMLPCEMTNAVDCSESDACHSFLYVKSTSPMLVLSVWRKATYYINVVGQRRCVYGVLTTFTFQGVGDNVRRRWKRQR
jgi:hypothetical protein